MALQKIASWNGTELDWDKYEFSKSQALEKKSSGSRRRPDKAENVLRISGLPMGTDENSIANLLSDQLDSELLGLVYYRALE